MPIINAYSTCHVKDHVKENIDEYKKKWENYYKHIEEVIKNLEIREKTIIEKPDNNELCLLVENLDKEISNIKNIIYILEENNNKNITMEELNELIDDVKASFEMVINQTPRINNEFELLQNQIKTINEQIKTINEQINKPIIIDVKEEIINEKKTIPKLQINTLKNRKY